jgi:hypothetical protein
MRMCDKKGLFCPLCYEGRRGRRFHKGHFGWRRWQIQEDSEMAQFLQGPPREGAARHISKAVEVCALSSTYPALWEHLTESAWESGQVRITSTLMIFVEDGLVKLCLHDRSFGRTAWVAKPSLTAALESLEEGLEGDSVEWRRARQPRKS